MGCRRGGGHGLLLVGRLAPWGGSVPGGPGLLLHGNTIHSGSIPHNHYRGGYTPAPNVRPVAASPRGSATLAQRPALHRRRASGGEGVTVCSW